MILQFDQAPDETTLAALAARGITVLAAVPENGLLVKTPDAVSFRGLGVRYAGRLDPSDKISPLFTSASPGALVEFHPDVDLNHARALLLGQGIELRENPDLNPHHLLIRATSSAALARISQLDEVAYIFPASDEMVRGVPVRAYAEPLTSGGLVGQYIAANGPGWDGSGLSAATIFYFFSSLTSQVATGSIESEVERAMAEWSKVVQVNWQAGASASAKRTVNILFAAGNHGDGFPFQPGVLAHTFYPAPPNPEPIAGDLHFNEAEPWHVGANMDVFSVALHELGHALGLGHSDNPNDVMYPYYKMVTTLAAGDKAAILTMYAPQTGAAGSGAGAAHSAERPAASFGPHAAHQPAASSLARDRHDAAGLEHPFAGR